MNLYLFKREQVNPGEYAGFLIRAASYEEATTLIGNNYNTDYSGWNYSGWNYTGEHYLYEFTITLIASGVTGEPGVLLKDFKGQPNSRTIN